MPASTSARHGLGSKNGFQPRPWSRGEELIFRIQKSPSGSSGAWERRFNSAPAAPPSPTVCCLARQARTGTGPRNQPQADVIWAPREGWAAPARRPGARTFGAPPLRSPRAREGHPRGCACTAGGCGRARGRARGCDRARLRRRVSVVFQRELISVNRSSTSQAQISERAEVGYLISLP